MHLTRKAAPINLPIAKKGSKYLVRAASHTYQSVPVLIAVRDMLKLASSLREVKHMIHNKLLKINGKLVRDYKESITLFSIFEADKSYILSILPTEKFTFTPSSSSTRLTKITSRTLVSNNKIQLNLHDCTNIIGKENMKVGDSLMLDSGNKVKSHIPLEKGSSAFIIKGYFAGKIGKIESISGKQVKIKVEKEESVLPLENIFVQ